MQLISVFYLLLTLHSSLPFSLTLTCTGDVRFLLKMHAFLIIYTFVRLTTLAHVVGDAVPHPTTYPCAMWGWRDAITSRNAPMTWEAVWVCQWHIHKGTAKSKWEWWYMSMNKNGKRKYQHHLDNSATIAQLPYMTIPYIQINSLYRKNIMGNADIKLVQVEEGGNIS